MHTNVIRSKDANKSSPCATEVTPAAPRSMETVTLRDALHGNEPPLYSDSEREWIPAVWRTFETKVEYVTGKYVDMLGVRLSLPAGITSKNIDTAVECSIKEGGLLFEAKFLLPPSSKDAKAYYAPHITAVKKKMMLAAAQDDQAAFDSLFKTSKEMDKWLEAEQGQINEERNQLRENQQHSFFRFFLEKECSRVKSIEFQVGETPEDNSVLVKILVKRDDEYEEQAKVQAYKPVGSSGNV